MLTAVWSTKGGVGVSTVAAMLAVSEAERGSDALLVDLTGDLPAVLGMAEPPGLGVSDWLHEPRPSPEALARIESKLRPGLGLIGRGEASPPGNSKRLAEVLGASQRPIVVDAGRIGCNPWALDVVEAATASLLVTRTCYLALHRARDVAPPATGVVLLREGGRALGLGDVEAVVEAPVVAEIHIDRSIARCIDAGVITTRLPRRLLRSLAGIASHEN